MKKFLCLVVALLLVGMVALCEGIDVSSLSDNELLELRDQVDNAISDRGLLSGTTLPSGKFVVGEDIKEGKYIIHTSASERSGHIRLYASESDVESFNSFYDHVIYDRAIQHNYIYLKEGNVLVFDFVGYATIEKATMIE